MKKLVLAVALSAALVTNGQAASAGPLRVNGAPVDASGSYVHQNTTYVPLRTITEALRPDAEVDWVKDRAVVRAEGLKLTARPGDAYIEANGRTLYAKDGVHLKAGRTLVPVRVLAEALGATVDWNPATGVVSVNGEAAQRRSPTTTGRTSSTGCPASSRRRAGESLWRDRSQWATWYLTGWIPRTSRTPSTV